MRFEKVKHKQKREIRFKKTRNSKKQYTHTHK